MNERNLKIDVVFKASRVVVIRWFSLNDAPLGLFKFISDYLSYFEKNKYIFQYHSKKSLNEFIRIDRNYLFGSFEITPIRLYTSLRNPIRGVYNLIEIISSWTEQKLRSILNNISVISWMSVLLEKIRIPRENHRHAASHWHTLSHNVVSSKPRHERDWTSQR